MRMHKIFFFSVDGLSPAARRVLMHLFSISQVRFDKPVPAKPFVKPGALMFWVVSGRGSMRIGNKRWPLEPGPSFFLVGTEQEREVIPDPGGPLLARTFWFGGPALDGWMEQLGAQDQPQFRVAHPERVWRAYERMYSLIIRRPANWEWSIHEMLNVILGEFLLSRRVLAPGRGDLPPRIAKVLTAMECDPSRNWCDADMAKVAGMSKSAFRDLFVTTMHQTPLAYRTSKRLTLAKDMLEDRHLLVKEIAAKLHFSSKHYFSSFFRKHVGISPVEFRNTMEKWSDRR